MKKNLKNIAKILIVSVLLTSCASENLDIPNQDPPLVMAKKWFETSKPDLKVLNYTNTIDWNNSIISSGDKGTIIEVPLLLKDNVVAKVGDDKSFKTYNRLMFFPDEKETYKAYQVLITTNDKTFDSKSKECNFYKLNTDFNGYITVLNSKNEITDFDKYLDLKPVSKPILNKTATDPVVCVYYGYWDENDEFHAYYQVGCYGGGSGSSGGTSYGSGGGKGDADPAIAEKALCDASLADIASQGMVTSIPLTPTTIYEDSNNKNELYPWQIYSISQYKIFSLETKVTKKVVNSNPDLQWQWVSLTHNSIYATGTTVGFEIVNTENGAVSNIISPYNATMSVNFNVAISLDCSGLKSVTNRNFTAFASISAKH